MKDLKTLPEGASLAAKILAVMADVEEVAKDSVNAFHKYKYASDAAIITEVRKAMIAHRLIAIPDQKRCDVVGEMTTITVEYTLIDADSGESTKATVHGQGKDSGDKGAYKAATGAEKYFFLKTFLIPTTDDPESNGNGKAEQRPAAKSGPWKPSPKPAPAPAPPKPAPAPAEKVPEKGPMKMNEKDENDCLLGAEIVDAFYAAETLEALEQLASKHKDEIVGFKKDLKDWVRQEYVSVRKRFLTEPAESQKRGK